MKVEIGEIVTTETFTDQIIEVDLEADGTIIGQVIGATITSLTIDEGNNRPNYGQNTQQTFRNRSQSSDSVRNYNNDHMTGRDRDRNNDKQV